jgi:hypothetical protein
LVEERQLPPFGRGKDKVAAARYGGIATRDGQIVSVNIGTYDPTAWHYLGNPD